MFSGVRVIARSKTFLLHKLKKSQQLEEGAVGRELEAEGLSEQEEVKRLKNKRQTERGFYTMVNHLQVHFSITKLTGDTTVCVVQLI